MLLLQYCAVLTLNESSLDFFIYLQNFFLVLSLTRILLIFHRIRISK
jgi:hypothetical protein